MKEEDPSLKKVAVELFKMQPDALVEFFEIDFSNLQEDFRELEEKYGKPLDGADKGGGKFDAVVEACARFIQELTAQQRSCGKLQMELI